MKKKIIFFCPSIEIGGVEKNLNKVINFFAQKNIDLYLVTSNKNLKAQFHKTKSFEYLCTQYFVYF